MFQLNHAVADIIPSADTEECAVIVRTIDFPPATGRLFCLIIEGGAGAPIAGTTSQAAVTTSMPPTPQAPGLLGIGSSSARLITTMFMKEQRDHSDLISMRASVLKSRLGHGISTLS